VGRKIRVHNPPIAIIAIETSRLHLEADRRINAPPVSSATMSANSTAA
jgi:hypothetical protein